MGLAHLAVRVGVAHESGADRYTQPAALQIGSADEDRRIEVVRGLAGEDRVGARREQRRDAGVVPARSGLVARDHRARVLHGGAGHRRCEHRLAQDVARIQPAASAQDVLGVGETRHLLQVRTGDAPAVGADRAHHLELFVHDHEQLFGLFGRLQELRQRLDGRPSLGMTERARNRVHRHDAVPSAHVGLRARAHGDVARRHDGEGPVRAALVLEQGAEPGQGRGGGIRVHSRGEIPPDHEVRALAESDLVGDHPTHDLRVVLVGDVEPRVGEGDRGGGQLLEGIAPVDHRAIPNHEAAQGSPIVVALEAALAHLPERHEREHLLGGAVRAGERDVGEQLDIHDVAGEQLDRGGIARDERERDAARGEFDQSGGTGVGHRGLRYGAGGRHETKKPPWGGLWSGNASTPPRRRATRCGSRACGHDIRRADAGRHAPHRLGVLRPPASVRPRVVGWGTCQP